MNSIEPNNKLPIRFAVLRPDMWTPLLIPATIEGDVAEGNVNAVRRGHYPSWRRRQRHAGTDPCRQRGNK